MSVGSTSFPPIAHVALRHLGFQHKIDDSGDEWQVIYFFSLVNNAFVMEIELIRSLVLKVREANGVEESR